MNTNWNDPNFQGFGGRQSPFGKRPPRPKKEHKAIGTPLTELLAALIRQQVPGTTVSADELSALVLQREILTLQLAADSAASPRAKGLLDQVHGSQPRSAKGRR